MVTSVLMQYSFLNLRYKFFLERRHLFNVRFFVPFVISVLLVKRSALEKFFFYFWQIFYGNRSKFRILQIRERRRIRRFEQSKAIRLRSRLINYSVSISYNFKHYEVDYYTRMSMVLGFPTILHLATVFRNRLFWFSLMQEMAVIFKQ